MNEKQIELWIREQRVFFWEKFGVVLNIEELMFLNDDIYGVKKSVLKPNKFVSFKERSMLKKEKNEILVMPYGIEEKPLLEFF